MTVHRWSSGDPALLNSACSRSRVWRRSRRCGACLLLFFAAICSMEHVQAQDRWEPGIADARLRVCIWPDYRGISFRDPRSGELSGIDIDLARAFAADLGKVLEFVDSSFSRLVADVQGNRCDVAMFGVGMTQERAAALAFTQPYLASDIYAIALRSQARIRNWDDIDQPQAVVAVARGTLHEAWMPRVMQRAQMVVLDTPAAREQEVQSGRADVFLTDYPFASHLVREARWAQLIAPPRTMQLTRYAYATRPALPRWTARVDRFVSDIKRDGRLRAAATAHGLETIIQP